MSDSATLRPIDLTIPEVEVLAPDHEHADHHDHDHDHDHTINLRLRIINLLGVTLPFVGFLVAMVLLWGVAFNWVYLALLVTFYVGSAVGITVGYHRYFTHRSFRTNKVVEASLAILGSMAMEGSILQWAAVHRSHHQHSDHHDDPHSPHGHGTSFWGMIKGMWHAHVGWMFQGQLPNLDRYVVDLKQDPLISWMSRRWWVWTVAGLVLPGIIGGLITMSWTGALLGFLWGGPVRVFLVHHVTWSINSVCHIWGSRPFKSHDESRNNPIFGVLAMGEGWHNNHHAFPTSARHGLRWWQIDFSYMIIRGLGMLGLASDIRVPSKERLEAKLRH
jgi:stearoyl-CoA desaturase (delta-9 desaturase)